MTGNPYPGLRPFERDDAHLFFGREKPVTELVALLARNRFLAVVGVSGSGKSSLVKAGLLPALHLGAMGEEFPDWRVAVMTPAGDPLGELCKSLSGVKALGPDPDCRSLLESSSRGLIERTLRAGLEDGAHLLVVVDQFEEIFRYRKNRAEGPEQAARFVRLLLEATEEKEQWARIYVLITMRSDFLGECAEFHDLPEALNRCQYLVPRMARDQRREAIEKPARAAGAEIEALLVDRLLNDAGDDAGQLPVLQHALNRTFAEWKKARVAGEIKLAHYEAAGKLEDALNKHADALLDAPGDPEGGWTGRVFRCLTTVEGGRRVRRPTPLSLLYEVVGAGDEEKKELVRKVIERYADPGASMISLKGPDHAGETIADISHESLISKWKKLKRWVDVETEAVRVYQAAADDVSHYGPGARWRGMKLDKALAYTDPERGVWNESWAARLKAKASYQQVCVFLKSQKANQEKEERQKKRLTVAAIILLFVTLALGSIVGYDKYRQVALEKARAESDKARLELLDREGKLRKQIAASDELLQQSEKKARDYESQIARAGQSPDAKRLQSELDELRGQIKQIQGQRNGAEASLSTESKNRTRVNPADGLTYVFIPPGPFTMGCSPGDTECLKDFDPPPHAEQIDKGFWLCQTEVTQAAWKKVKGETNPSFFKSDQLPVEKVDWNDAGDYCKTIGGRLPTEKEWEYAARARTTGSRYGAIGDVAWYAGNSGETTHPVGLKQPNAFGLYDMLGNVWESTSDDFGDGRKVVRGGSWFNNNAWFFRASYRNGVVPTRRDNYLGFRCVGEFR